MADNDRLANGGSLGANPGWKADVDVRSDTPLLTQNLQGIGWQTSGESRMVVSKNAAGLPGWRARIFVPENLAQITLGTSNVIVTDMYDYIIPSGSYIEKGTEVKLHQALGETTSRGCKATVQRQDTTDLNFWFTNYVDNHNNGHLAKSWVVNEDTHIISEARDRVNATFAAGVNGVITANINGTSWGPRGYQSTSLNLTTTFQSIITLEFFRYDQLNTTYIVDAGYDWADFTAGSEPQATNVEPTTVGANGGTYNFEMEDDLTYIAMTAYVSSAFFVNQPGSATFTNTRVTVTEIPNVRIHKTGVTMPYVGERIDYGKNGATGDHPRLYAGTKLTLTVTSANTYIAANVVTSTVSTTPNPGVPTDTDSYTSITVTMTGTPIFAVGLYYIKTGLVQTTRTVSRTNQSFTYDTFTANLPDSANDIIDGNVTRLSTIAWTKPSGAVAAWLQNVSWSWSQSSSFGVGPGPSEPVYKPDSRGGAFTGSQITTGPVENTMFTGTWYAGLSSYEEGENFTMTMYGDVCNLTITPGSLGWLNNVYTLNTSWSFTPILIAATGAA